MSKEFVVARARARDRRIFSRHICASFAYTPGGCRCTSLEINAEPEVVPLKIFASDVARANRER